MNTNSGKVMKFPNFFASIYLNFHFLKLSNESVFETELDFIEDEFFMPQMTGKKH